MTLDCCRMPDLANVLVERFGSVDKTNQHNKHRQCWRHIIILKLCVLSLISISAFAAGGACPANLPVTGNNCYFIAATGADTNSGTSEAAPWLHAPGMPNCSKNCAAVNPSSGQGFIFRGGDTWHFGNSSASPYTGGALDMYSLNWGNNATCLGFGLTTCRLHLLWGRRDLVQFGLRCIVVPSDLHRRQSYFDRTCRQL